MRLQYITEDISVRNMAGFFTNRMDIDDVMIFADWLEEHGRLDIADIEE